MGYAPVSLDELNETGFSSSCEMEDMAVDTCLRTDLVEESKSEERESA